MGRFGAGLYVSHDLAVAAQMADGIVVPRDGVIREVDSTGRILSAPQHPYRQSLLAAARPTVRGAGVPDKEAAPLLEVRGLTTGYGCVPVLQDITLAIPRGASLGEIGESGCGESTLARVVAGLLPAGQGSIRLAGQALPAAVARRTPDQLRRIQLVFPSADTALNPRRTVAQILGWPLAFFHGVRGAEHGAWQHRFRDRRGAEERPAVDGRRHEEGAGCRSPGTGERGECAAEPS